MSPFVSINNLSFSFDDKSEKLFKSFSFDLEKGHHLFLEGESGSGKSTFLELLTGIRKPTSGTITILDEELSNKSSQQLDVFRSKHFGIIFQTFNLLPHLTVKENLELGLLFSPSKKEKILSQNKTVDDEILRILGSLKIESSLLHQKCTQLSVGQQQRIAAARAFLGSPEIIVTDEPTSALDDKVADLFMELLFKEAETNDSTIIFVSHNKQLMNRFSKVLSINNIKRDE